MHVHDHLPHCLVEADARRVSQDGESYFEVNASAVVQVNVKKIMEAVVTEIERNNVR